MRLVSALMVLAKMGRNEFISMESLSKICAALNCDVEDIISFSNAEGRAMRGKIPHIVQYQGSKTNFGTANFTVYAKQV